MSKYPLPFHLILFIATSVFGVIYKHWFLLAIVVAVQLACILLKKRLTLTSLKIILIMSLVYSFSWILVSSVPGTIQYIQWPWGTIVSDVTLTVLLQVLLRLYVLFFAGIIFLTSMPEDILYNELRRYHVPKKVILMLTLMTNTAYFLLDDYHNFKQNQRFRNTAYKKRKLYFLYVRLRTILIFQLRRIAVTVVTFTNRFKNA